MCLLHFITHVGSCCTRTALATYFSVVMLWTCLFVSAEEKFFATAPSQVCDLGGEAQEEIAAGTAIELRSCIRFRNFVLNKKFFYANSRNP